MSRASTGSALRRYERAPDSHAARLESSVTEPAPFLWPSTPVIVFMIAGRQVKDGHLILVNHRDPVMASHLVGGDGRPVAIAGTAARACPDSREIP
jgi:hypothetical protein